MFVRRPELLVLDDLSSALDVETERQLWERLFAGEHPTLLIVSHRPEALRRADHILVLRDGAVEAYGTLAARAGAANPLANGLVTHAPRYVCGACQGDDPRGCRCCEQCGTLLARR